MGVWALAVAPNSGSYAEVVVMKSACRGPREPIVTSTNRTHQKHTHSWNILEGITLNLRPGEFHGDREEMAGTVFPNSSSDILQ